MANRKTKAAAISIASNTTLILLKIVAGLITGSVSLIAEAIHSIMDLWRLSSLFQRQGIGPARGQETPVRHGKAENLSGVIEGVLILVAAGLIVYEAIQKIIMASALK